MRQRGMWFRHDVLLARVVTVHADVDFEWFAAMARTVLPFGLYPPIGATLGGQVEVPS